MNGVALVAPFLIFLTTTQKRGARMIETILTLATCGLGYFALNLMVLYLAFTRRDLEAWRKDHPELDDIEPWLIITVLGFVIAPMFIFLLFFGGNAAGKTRGRK